MDYKVLSGCNCDLNTQLLMLKDILYKSDALSTAINKACKLGLKNYYIGAGCVAQTVWNYLSGYPLEYGIGDIDFVYFDDSDLSLEAENRVVNMVKAAFGDLPIKIDVKNEARVHLWYDKHFGYKIEPYTSLEDAVNTWPTTATAIGVRKSENGSLVVYAPFGLNDLFGKVVRANKRQITEDIYEAKTHKWIGKWKDLIIVPWNK